MLKGDGKIKKYKYKINQVVTNVKYGKLKIIKQIKIPHSRSNGRCDYDKGYEYECLICSNIDKISESNLCNNKNGCNVCSNQKVLIGFNDIHTTHPELFNLLFNKEHGYKYTYGSSKKIDWVCPDCGNIIKNKSFNFVSKYGLKCAKCSDGKSYAEKFFFGFLQQILNNDFETEKLFNWSKNIQHNNLELCGDKIYDFYFTYNNKIICETHGMQHYEDRTSNSKFKKSITEEQENDKLKKELALQNDIKEENYVVIDCRKSELEWIKNSILNSNLPQLLNFKEENINWLKCHEYACNSLVKVACELWNSQKSISNISKITKLDKGTIRKYLKQGNELKWCYYNPKQEYDNSLKNLKEINAKKVICLNNNIVFNSIKKVYEKYNIDGSSISACCNGKRKSAGKNPKNGEKLIWMYYSDYLIKYGCETYDS